MDIRQLQYFIATAEHLNFTEAARHLYISQSALSQQIADLENQLGVSLFVRNRHSTLITAAGTALLQEAKIIVANVDNAIRITRQAASGLTGRLKIGYLGFAEKNFLPKLISSFRSKHALIELSFQQFSHGAMDEALDHADIDIGFIQNWDMTTLPRIYWKKIYTDTLCLVVPSNHPLVNETSITHSIVCKESFIFHPKAAPRGFVNLLRVCSNRGFTPAVNPVSDILTVLMMVEAGLGVSLLPRHIPIGYASSALHMVNIEGVDVPIHVSVAWNQINTNPCIPLFLNEVEALSQRM